MTALSGIRRSITRSAALLTGARELHRSNFLRVTNGKTIIAHWGRDCSWLSVSIVRLGLITVERLGSIRRRYVLTQPARVCV